MLQMRKLSQNQVVVKCPGLPSSKPPYHSTATNWVHKKGPQETSLDPPPLRAALGNTDLYRIRANAQPWPDEVAPHFRLYWNVSIKQNQTKKDCEDWSSLEAEVFGVPGWATMPCPSPHLSTALTVPSSLSLNFLQYYTERLSDFLPLRQVVLGWILPSLYQLCLTEGLKDTKVPLEYTVTFS